MSLTREDMLRELELLPAWRVRMPASPNLSSATIAEPVATMEETIAVAVELSPEPVVEAVPEAVAIESPIPETLQASPDALPALEAPNVPTATAELLVQTPWLLYCPSASESASQPLLQNILRALQLPLEEVSLYQQRLHMTQVKTRFCVLFGLEQANQFLTAEHAEISTVRGQVLTYGEMMVIITHHPSAMLENPSLKKEVWQDLCLLLAKHREAAA